jgi:hypothetical protein
MFMNIHTAYIVYLMPPNAAHQSASAWLMSQDFFQLSPAAFLIRADSIEALTAEIQSRVTDSNAFFVCRLAEQVQISGSAPVHFELLQWLHKR